MNHTATRSASASAGLVAGIDVSKATLDIATWPATSIEQVANDDDGHARLIELLRRHAPALVVVEATGGYERSVVAALQQAGFTVALANPKAVRDFAKAHGIFAKTDRIDASVIARYGHDVGPRTLACADETRQNRDDLVTRRRQLVEQRATEKARLDHARRQAIRDSIRDHIEHLDEQIAQLDEQINQSIQDDPQAKAVADQLQTVKGVGPVLTSTLIAEMPELGTLTRAAAAALVGVAPFNDDSGRHKGKRFIRGGRAAVRNVLYMAALTAVRCNTVLAQHYRQLKNRGKPNKVAIVACMRKLIIYLNNLARAVLLRTTTLHTVP